MINIFKFHIVKFFGRHVSTISRLQKLQLPDRLNDQPRKSHCKVTTQCQYVQIVADRLHDPLKTATSTARTTHGQHGGPVGRIVPFCDFWFYSDTKYLNLFSPYCLSTRIKMLWGICKGLVLFVLQILIRSLHEYLRNHEKYKCCVRSVRKCIQYRTLYVYGVYFT